MRDNLGGFRVSICCQDSRVIGSRNNSKGRGRCRAQTAGEKIYEGGRLREHEADAGKA